MLRIALERCTASGTQFYHPAQMPPSTVKMTPEV
jgi:hypothetical protein